MAYVLNKYWINGYAVGDGLDMIVANSVQSATSALAKITSTHILNGSASSSVPQSGVIAVTFVQLIAVAPCSQSSSSTTGIITAIQRIVAAPAAQASISLAATIDTSIRILQATSAVQNNASSNSGISVVQVLSSSIDTQNNNSINTKGILVVQIMLALPVIQENVSKGAGVSLTKYMVVSTSIQSANSAKFDNVRLQQDNKLRILFKNLVKDSDISTTNTADSFDVSSLKDPGRTNKWRSNASVDNSLKVVFNKPGNVNCIILPYCNLTKDSNIIAFLYKQGNNLREVRLKVLMDTNTSHAVAYFPMYTDIDQIAFNISSTKAIELSEIVCGEYWEPTNNTETGLSLEVLDASTKYRTQTGDSMRNILGQHKYLNIPLSYLSIEDKNKMFNLLRSAGSRNPIFVSVFPGNPSIEKELMYQVHGRLANLATLTNPQFQVYSSSLAIEEV